MKAHFSRISYIRRLCGIFDVPSNFLYISYPYRSILAEEIVNSGEAFIGKREDNLPTFHYV